jgi:hypothetical protein
LTNLWLKARFEFAKVEENITSVATIGFQKAVRLPPHYDRAVVFR